MVAVVTRDSVAVENGVDGTVVALVACRITTVGGTLLNSTILAERTS
jgi:hypothetical protein|tara:strand:- start:210 stop:350 length:141 start_codon:yes stop_codon:yes gene_type:complete